MTIEGLPSEPPIPTSNAFCFLCRVEMTFLSIETFDQVICLTEGCKFHEWPMPVDGVREVNELMGLKNGSAN